MSGETERRRATILFADLAGSTAFVERAGDEAAYGVVTRCLALLDQIARRHGASLVKDRGDCVLAVFGAPQAMEQGPRAAVNAAIEMRDAVRTLVGAGRVPQREKCSTKRGVPAGIESRSLHADHLAFEFPQRVISVTGGPAARP